MTDRQTASALSAVLLCRFNYQGLYRANSLCHHPAITRGVEMIVAWEDECGILVVLNIVNWWANEIALNTLRSKSTDNAGYICIHFRATFAVSEHIVDANPNDCDAGTCRHRRI